MKQAAKSVLKVIGKIILYIVGGAIGVVLFIAASPVLIPYYIIKGDTSEKKGIKKSKTVRVPKYSASMSQRDYVVYCADRLKRDGYRNLVVNAAERTYGADIVGYDSRVNKVCFRCRKTNRAVDDAPVREVIAAKRIYGAKTAVAVTTSCFNSAARRLAKSEKVRLIEYYSEKPPKPPRKDDLGWIDEIEEFDALMN